MVKMTKNMYFSLVTPKSKQDRELNVTEISA